ncbi:MAG: hypothetical protein OXB91_13310 [Bryobacterales bacterium]|nr:hypothetical protein [Bryobacterales bacterium]
MKTTFRLTILLLTLACGMALAVPRLAEVVPDAVAPGGTAVAKGSDLARPVVDKLYLTAGGSDVELEITEQTADAITFKVPDGTAMKRYRLMFLTGGASPAYMEQPIALEIVDEATAKQRAEEGEVELEIIEAAPEAEPEN